MSDLSVDRITTSPRAKNWGYFSIVADVREVANLFQRLDSSISGLSLRRFLQNMASPYFEDEIIDRFAYEGDNHSGSWKELAPATERIRRQLGYPGSNPINERTQELLQFVAFHRDYAVAPNLAVMNVPGKPTSQSVEAKLITAQKGRDNNPMIPGAKTPPRPVLATGPDDMAAMLKMLQVHIMEQMATRMGGAQ